MRPALLLALLLLPSAGAEPRLVAVAPDLSGPGPGDEGFAIADPDGAADLSGFQVTDGETTWTIPEGVVAPAGGQAWFAGASDVWQGHDGPEVAAWFGTDLRLGNDGDDLHLLDPSGAALDTFRWGDKATRAWEPMSYTSSDLVYRRMAGMDTDTGADWQTPRLHRIGESGHPMPTFTVDAVTAFVSPDSSFPIVTGLLESATHRLHLHVYELRTGVLVDALVAAAHREPGLDLQVLVDERPVGQEDFDRQETAEALWRIQEAGGSASLAGHGRYDYHHLKVLVVDDAVAVMTENWVPAGIPEDPSWGNRGWGIVIQDAAAADWMVDVLAADRDAWDTKTFDLAQYDPLHEAPPRFAPRSGAYVPRFPSQTFAGPLDVTFVISPEHTARPEEDPVSALVRTAGTVHAEQLDLTRWAANDLDWVRRDPYMEALSATGPEGRVVAAAPFRFDDTENQDAMAELPTGLGCEFSVEGLLLHAKGTVGGERVALGSMNQNHHSRSENREVSVIVDAPDVASYFREVVVHDASSCGPARSIPVSVVPTLIATLCVAPMLRRR